ncbi:MAG: hypothetical protein ACLUOI_24140 [Eisenbergiella sp.]
MAIRYPVTGSRMKTVSGRKRKDRMCPATKYRQGVAESAGMMCPKQRIRKFGFGNSVSGNSISAIPCRIIRCRGNDTSEKAEAEKDTADEEEEEGGGPETVYPGMTSVNDVSGNNVSGNDVSGNGVSDNDISGNTVSGSDIVYRRGKMNPG